MEFNLIMFDELPREKLFRSRVYKGKAPKKAETVELALRDLIKTTEVWLRRYEESWFDRDEYPTLELGVIKSGNLKVIPVLCDDAIEGLALLAKYATTGQKALKKLKRAAKKRAADA